MSWAFYTASGVAKTGEYLGSEFAIGTVVQTANTSPKEGWLLCDGSTVSRTTYAELFAAIGTTYGTGNGTTTFNLPDATGYVIYAQSITARYDAISKLTTVQNFYSGTFANRPAAATSGRYYYATDTSKLYLDLGDSWIEVTSGASVADGAITTAKLADSSATTAKIADSAVTTAKLNDSSVTSVKVASGAIDNTKFASGVGAWTSYTPVLQAATTNPTLDATPTGRYVQIGKLVTYQFFIQFGAAMNPGSGIYRIVLPVTSSRSKLGGNVTLGEVRLYDSSANVNIMTNFFVHDADAYVRIAYADYNSSAGDVTNAAPWTWAASDVITGTITYEAA